MLRRWLIPCLALLLGTVLLATDFGSPFFMLRVLGGVSLICPAAGAIDRRWIGPAGARPGARDLRPKALAWMPFAPALVILPLVAASYLGCLPRRIARLAGAPWWFIAVMIGLMIGLLVYVPVLDCLVFWRAARRSANDADAPRCPPCQARSRKELWYAAGGNVIFAVVAFLLATAYSRGCLPARVVAFLGRRPAALALAIICWQIVVGLLSGWFAHAGPDPDSPRCPRCGYSLKGSIGLGCPECGLGRDDKASPASDAGARRQDKPAGGRPC